LNERNAVDSKDEASPDLTRCAITMGYT